MRRRDFSGGKSNSSAVWGMVSKPTKSHGVMARMEMTQAHEERPSAKRGKRFFTWAVSAATLPAVSTSTPPAKAKARMSWRLLAMSMPRKFM